MSVKGPCQYYRASSLQKAIWTKKQSCNTHCHLYTDSSMYATPPQYKLTMPWSNQVTIATCQNSYISPSSKVIYWKHRVLTSPIGITPLVILSESDRTENVQQHTMWFQVLLEMGKDRLFKVETSELLDQRFHIIELRRAETQYLQLHIGVRRLLGLGGTPWKGHSHVDYSHFLLQVENSEITLRILHFWSRIYGLH